MAYAHREYVVFPVPLSHSAIRNVLERISPKMDNKCGNYQGWKLSRIEFHVFL